MNLCPIYWEQFCATSERQIQKSATLEGVTPWFSGLTHPVRQGWYERLLADDLYRHYWNGVHWTVMGEGDIMKPHWRQVGAYPLWRGLLAPIGGA